MALKTIDQRPAVTDTVLFDLYTTDGDDLATPYKVDLVTIYFLERDHVSRSYQEYSADVRGVQTKYYYRDAVPVKVFGTDDSPAWLSSDTANALLEKVDFDAAGSPEVGHFRLEWHPEMCQEGDYFLCYTWTALPAGDPASEVVRFYLVSDESPPVATTRRTSPARYEELLERWLPEMFKATLLRQDLTPDVLERFNSAVAAGFADLDGLISRMVDLRDANVVGEKLLPYLANHFRWRLRSQDPALWRRQVRRAVPLYKKKGTVDGLREALATIGAEFRKLTTYWQVYSRSSYQESFVYAGDPSLKLSKTAILPAVGQVWYRKAGTAEYVEAAFTVANAAAVTTGCPPGSASVSTLTLDDPSPLDDGDIVRVLYKYAEPADQQVEDYLLSLPLMDQRDEFTAVPVKNWNTRLAADDDILLPLLCPTLHPFAYPVVYGRVRTMFPYSENIYNMEEYNASTRDSTDPCDLDANFVDPCGCCRASRISVDVSVDALSDDRISEVRDVIREFTPFHAQLHSVNFIGSHEDIVLPPVERVECLVRVVVNETVALSQFDFNRVVEEGNSDDGELTRSMLADATTAASGNDGTGFNLAVSLYAPGVNFNNLGIDAPDNILEILSGTYAGEYSAAPNGSPTADVVGLDPSPLDPSGFPFRLSNVLYEESGVSVYQDNLVKFTDPDADFSQFPVPADGTWAVVTGSVAYPVSDILPDGSLVLQGWGLPAATDLTYDLTAPASVVVVSGEAGRVAVASRGRLETALALEYGVRPNDWAAVDGDRYPILYAEARPSSPTVDKFYLDGYAGGDVVGSVTATFTRVLAETTGYLAFRGNLLRTVADYESVLGVQDGANPVSDPTETSDFKGNYLVLLGDTYYQVAAWDGTDITLAGPVRDWGLAGTAGVEYSIIHFENLPVTTQNGKDYSFIDRRGDNSFTVTQINATPMALRMQALNGADLSDAVRATESVTCQINIR